MYTEDPLEIASTLTEGEIRKDPELRGLGLASPGNEGNGPIESASTMTECEIRKDPELRGLGLASPAEGVAANYEEPPLDPDAEMIDDTRAMTALAFREISGDTEFGGQLARAVEDAPQPAGRIEAIAEKSWEHMQELMNEARCNAANDADESDPPSELFSLAESLANQNAKLEEGLVEEYSR